MEGGGWRVGVGKDSHEEGGKEEEKFKNHKSKVVGMGQGGARGDNEAGPGQAEETPTTDY